MLRNAASSEFSPVTKSADGVRRELSKEELTRLRMTLGRLGRLLRQQNDDGLSYALVSLLFAIGRNEPATAGELAASEGVSPPSVTRSLNRLIELGFVSREADAADRRAAVIKLTAAGRKERAQILRTREVWLTQHLSRLSPPDVEAVVAALPALERLVDPKLLGQPKSARRSRSDRASNGRARSPSR